MEQIASLQQKIINNPKDNRNINIIIDDGSLDKANLYDISYKIPCYKNIQDVMRFIMNNPIKSIYFIDVPILTKNKMIEFYNGIEQIKSGYCFDKRYKFKEIWFDSPEVWCFTTEEPNILFLDKWKIWKIIDNELININ